MGKKYFDTKKDTLESSILGVWAEAAKKQEGLDAVNPKALKKKFDDRKDKDIDNDGDTDDSDEYLHNRRKTVSKAVKGEGNAFGMALKAAKDKGEKTFVVAGKKYDVKEAADLDEDSLGDFQDFARLYGGGDEIYVVTQGKDSNSLKVIGIEKDPNKAKKIRDRAKGARASLWGQMKSSQKVLKLKIGDPVSFEDSKNKLSFIEEVDLDEGLGVAKDIPAMEVGTDRYREYAVGLTPGENAEFAAAKDFKVASMKEALAKVWGLDEKALDKTSKEDYDEEDEELKPVKGSKTMTGGKVAKVDTKPKIDG